MSARTILISIVFAALSACGDDGDLLGPVPGQVTLGSITATPSALTLTTGQRITLTMQALSTTSQPITDATGYVFTSNAPDIASVSTGGEVTGVAAGSATVTASLTRGSVTRTVDVPVTVSGTAPGTASVTAGSTTNTFTPSSVAVSVGGTVTWTFGALEHNVNFQGASGAPADIGNTSNASVSRTFNTAGTFAYVCTLHSGMSGSVLVQ